MPAGNQITVVDTIESPENVTITVRPGSVIPMENAALGRAILAFQSDQGQRSAPLAEVLDQVRSQWWAVAVNERLPGVRSEEHTSELQSLMRISYAVFCLQH